MKGKKKTLAEAPASRRCQGRAREVRGFRESCALAASGHLRPTHVEPRLRFLRDAPRFSLPLQGRSPAACAARLSANRKKEGHDLKLASCTQAEESRRKSRVPLGHCRWNGQPAGGQWKHSMATAPSIQYQWAPPMPAAAVWGYRLLQGPVLGPPAAHSQCALLHLPALEASLSSGQDPCHLQPHFYYLLHLGVCGSPGWHCQGCGFYDSQCLWCCDSCW